MTSRNGFKKNPIPGDPSDPEGLTALLQRHLVWLETHNFAERTVNVRRLQLSRFISWCLDRSVTQARELTPDLLERFQRYLFYYRKHDGQPLSISSQNHWLTALRSWMAWLKDKGVLQENPALELTLPKEEKRLPRHALTREEVESILEQPDVNKVHGLRMRAILELFYSSGLRRKEVLELELGDIDRERRVILVRLGKGNKDRFVPLGARALHWIDKYLQEARPRLCTDPQQPLLFVTAKATAIHPNYVSALVRRYMNQAGITKKGACHLFRHTAASLMLDAGADVRHLQEILGHESLCSTQIYTHVSIGKLCEVHARTHPAGESPASPQRRAYRRALSAGSGRTGVPSSSARRASGRAWTCAARGSVSW